MTYVYRSWPEWYELFRARMRRPLPQVDRPNLSASQRRRLARSIGIFQVGEAGEGRIAVEIRSCSRSSINTVYCDALGLFVAEEARHARILASLLSILDAPLLTLAWSNCLFTALRRLLGIRFKLLVLMAAEVVGVSFYRLVATSIEPGRFAEAIGQIWRDELDHLLFHADFFVCQMNSSIDRVVFKAVWPPLGLVALGLACFDHRLTLSELGIGVDVFLGCGSRYIAKALNHCLSEDPLKVRPERQRASAE